MGEGARPGSGSHRLVAIGCSWGGLEAVSTLLEGLPSDLPVALVIVQHRLHGRSELAALLGQHTSWPVCEADDKEPIGVGQVYLAPPGYHLLVDGDRFALSTEAPVAGSRPSIDVLFESMADAFGPRVVGVVLTGANEDGAAGLREIVRRGGTAIVQDPASALKPVMPAAALAAVGDAARVAPLDELAALIVEVVTQREVGAS
jgi:two-component system chemotaxis response regulator CheB